MFLSNRFSTYELTGELNLLACTYEELSKKGNRIVDLTISNPTHANFSYPREKINYALNTHEIFEYHPHPQGLYSAREVISEYYAEKGWEVDPNDIFLVSGTSEGYSYLLKLLCNPGDSVLVPAPSYPLLDFIATLENVDVVPFELRLSSEGIWKLDLDNIHARLKPNTRAILFVQPNNPTGTILDKVDAQNLMALCEKNQICLIVDEVFREFTFRENEIVPLLSSSQIPVFTLNGISKTLALPQLKLGWIIAFLPSKYKKQLHEALEIISDTFLSVNTPVQVALRELFELKNDVKSMIMKRLKENLEYAIKKFSGRKDYKLYEPQGGWYLVVKFNSEIGSEEYAIELLKTKKVYVHPGYMFRFPEDKFLVISLLTPKSEFQSGIERLLEYTNFREST